MSAASEIALQLDDVIRTAFEMVATIGRGESPDLADARILRGQAECLERLVELARINQLRDAPAPTPEQDKAAQVTMARQQNARADAAELSKWSAA